MSSGTLSARVDFSALHELILDWHENPQLLLQFLATHFARHPPVLKSLCVIQLKDTARKALQQAFQALLNKFHGLQVLYFIAPFSKRLNISSITHHGATLTKLSIDTAARQDDTDESLFLSATDPSLIASLCPKLTQLGLPLYCLITSTEDAPDFDIIRPLSQAVPHA